MGRAARARCARWLKTAAAPPGHTKGMTLPSWMQPAPQMHLLAEDEAAFAAALATRDVARLPAHLPRWFFLQWVAAQGYLLHGSKVGDIDQFVPRTPTDIGPDEFSKRTGVFAASDGLWAMMYALRDKGLVRRTMNMAQQVMVGGQWSPMQYFLSFGPRDPAMQEGRALMTPGFVYVLPRTGFEQAPVLNWPGVGLCLEAHWVCPHPVRPLMVLPVIPEDYPLPVRVHDAERNDALAQRDPWGYPWLSEAD